MTAEEYITERLDDQIKWYDEKSVKSQKVFKRLKLLEMFFSASIPVLVIYWDIAFCIRTLVAVLGGAITILAGIQGLNKYHENWIEYRSTAEILKHEKFLYMTQSGIYKDNDAAFILLVERVESIISHENINWTQLNSYSCETKSL